LTPGGLELLLAKFSLCEKICDFSIPDADVQAREIKAATLRELDVIFADRQTVGKWPPALFNAFYRMVARNIWRNIPATDPILLDGLEEPVIAEDAWPHLQLVYGIIMKYQQANVNDKRMGRPFVMRLMGNLHVPDRSEREAVLLFIERHVACHREDQELVIRRFTHILRDYRDGLIEPFAIGPILKFLGSRWKDPSLSPTFLRERVRPELLYLVSARHLKSLFGPITHFFEVALDGDDRLGYDLIMTAMTRWPTRYPAKQAVLLELIIFIFSRLPKPVVTKIVHNVFGLFARCARSLHRDVVQSSFRVWTDDQFLASCSELTPVIYPLLVDHVVLASRRHWNPFIRKLATDTLAAMKRVDQKAFDRCERVPGRPSAASETTGLAAFQSLPSIGRKKLDREGTWLLVLRQANARWAEMRSPRLLADLQSSLTASDETDW
jgi:hypothetical protein